MSESNTNTDAQTMLARAREMLSAQGAPMTAENLNRAVLSIVQGGSANEPTQFDSAVEASLNEGRRGSGGANHANVMTPSPVEPQQQPVRIQLSLDNPATQPGATNNLNDRTMALNPTQYSGAHADQLGQRDTQARLLQNSGDDGAVGGTVAGNSGQPSSGQQVDVAPAAQRTGATSPTNGGPRQGPQQTVRDQVRAAADSPYLGMFTGAAPMNMVGGAGAAAGAGLSIGRPPSGGASLLERASGRLTGPGTDALAGPGGDAALSGPLAQRMLNSPDLQLPAPAARTIIPTRSAPPDVIPLNGTTLGPAQAAMLQGPGNAANAGVRAARRGTLNRR